MKKIIVVVAILVNTFAAMAQQGWEVGGWMGVSHYFGDLNTSNRLNAPRFAAGAVGRYNFNDRICAKLSANFGGVSGTDKTSKNSYERQRNLDFRSTIFDGSIQMEFRGHALLLLGWLLMVLRR